MPDRPLVAAVAVILVLSGLALIYTRYESGSPVDLFTHRVTQAELRARPEASLSPPGAIFLSRGGNDEQSQGWEPPQLASVWTVYAIPDPDPERQVDDWYDTQLQLRGWSRVDQTPGPYWRLGKLTLDVSFNSFLFPGPQPPAGYREFVSQLQSQASG